MKVNLVKKVKRKKMYMSEKLVKKLYLILEVLLMETTNSEQNKKEKLVEGRRLSLILRKLKKMLKSQQLKKEVKV